MLEAAQLLSGHTGDTVPANAVLAVRDEVLAHVRDHFRRLVPAMSSALVNVPTETEAARIVQEQFAGSTPVKQ
jgi:hypothetical protein